MSRAAALLSEEKITVQLNVGKSELKEIQRKHFKHYREVSNLMAPVKAELDRVGSHLNNQQELTKKDVARLEKHRDYLEAFIERSEEPLEAFVDMVDDLGNLL